MANLQVLEVGEIRKGRAFDASDHATLWRS